MKALVYALSICLCSSSFASEVETHGAITLNAFNFSVLGKDNSNQSELYLRLGFDRIDLRQPFVQTTGNPCVDPKNALQADDYLDVDPAWSSQRTARKACARTTRKSPFLLR